MTLSSRVEDQSLKTATLLDTESLPAWFRNLPLAFPDSAGNLCMYLQLDIQKMLKSCSVYYCKLVSHIKNILSKNLKSLEMYDYILRALACER